MPFRSESQRRFLFAKHPDVAREFADATPKGKKLPEKVKRAYVLGGAAALDKLGLKSAAEELRLKIPDRTFHGFDAARKAESERANKKADCTPGAEDSDDLEKMLEEGKAAGLTRQKLYASFRNPKTKVGQVVRRLEEEKAAAATAFDADDLATKMAEAAA